MSETKESKGLSFLATDFYIDFFGSLVPGLLAFVLAIIVLKLSASALLQCLTSYSTVLTPASLTPIDTTKSLNLGQWLDFSLGVYGNTSLILIASYVLGSVLYRQDPKYPDFRSARQIWRDAPHEEKRKLAVQPRDGGQDITAADAQFPYYFIHEYLSGRGLQHLAKWIPWQGGNKDSHGHRTKMYINILKIRLQYIVPDRCKDIIRNEAHVRLAISLWYATTWIISSVILGFAFILIGLAAVKKPAFIVSDVVMLAIGYDLLALMFAYLLKSRIEKFLHYLRVREIVYVLEAADFSSRCGQNLFREDFVLPVTSTRDKAGSLPKSALTGQEDIASP